MSVYRFKVYFEDDENVSREIEIKSTQTFEDLHNIIQKALSFDSLHPASFFVSNDSWRKGKEILLLHKSHTKGLKGTWMHETKIASLVDDPHQKFIYEFDPEGGAWLLHVELMKIVPDAAVTYPLIRKSIGNPPPQYKITTPVLAPAEEEEDEELVDDKEDIYVHPEAEVADHYHIKDEEEPAIMAKVAEPVEVFNEENEDDVEGGGDDENMEDVSEDGEELS